MVGLAIGAAAAMFSTAALADSVTIAVNTFTPTTNGGSGQQTTTTSKSSTQYNGSYTFTGTPSGSCFNNATAEFTYTDGSVLNVRFASLCFGGPSNFTIGTGNKGIFQNATGGGTLGFTQPNDWTLNAGTGSSFFGTGLSSTPELDSLALLGVGALGLGGYALTALRARKRRGSTD